MIYCIWAINTRMGYITLNTNSSFINSYGSTSGGGRKEEALQEPIIYSSVHWRRMPLPRGRVTYCIASFRNCLHFRIAVQPRLNQHASGQSLRCQRKQKFSSQAIIWEHIKDFVSHAKNLYNSWLVKQRKCSQKGFGFLLQAYSVADNLLFLACTEIEEQGQSSALLDTVIRSGTSSNTGKFSECSSTSQHRGSNQQHPTSSPRTEWHCDHPPSASSSRCPSYLLEDISLLQVVFPPILHGCIVHSLNGTVNGLENHILLQHLRNNIQHVTVPFNWSSFAPQVMAGETTVQ